MRIEARSLDLDRKNVILNSIGWKGDDFLNLLLLSFVYGVYFLLLTIAVYLPGGISESEETIVFIQGWVTIPILSFLALVTIHKYKSVGNKEDGFFYPVFLSSNYILCLIFTVGLRLSWWLFPSLILLSRVVNTILVLFPLIQIALLWTLRKYRASLARTVREKFVQFLYGFLPIIVVLFVANFSNRYVIIVIPVAAIFFAILFSRLSKFFIVSSKTRSRWMSLLIDITAFLIIIGACFDPKFAVWIYHQNYYLGPVNALLHGRIILVNVFSQYGVLVLEFLALIFKMKLVPLSYQGLSFLVALLCMLQYAVIYLLLRAVLKSPWLSFLGLLVILLLNFFATINFFQATPSIGPLRFGLCYLMMVLCVLYYKYPAINRIFLFFVYVVLGLASLWSFESFVYVAFMFLGMMVYQSIITNGQELWKVIQSILHTSFWAFLSIGLCQAIMAGAIFLETSDWPKWGYYFEYVILYEKGFGSLPVDPWSPWLFVIAIYFLCLSSYVIKWLIDRKLDATVERATILCLSFFGIAQFTYYLGRSHPNNFFHVSVPAIIIAFYGIDQIGKLPLKKYFLFSQSATISFIIALTFLCTLYLPQFLTKFPNTGFDFVRALVEDQQVEKYSTEKFLIDEYNLLWARQPSSEEVTDAVYLIRKYAGEQTSVTVFLSNDSTTETLLLSNKIHTYLIDHPSENILSAQVRQFIYDHAPTLHIGDMIFLASDPSQLLLQDQVAPIQFAQDMELQQQLVLQLCEQFSFEKVEATLHGVTAFVLRPVGSEPSDYCIRLITTK